MKNVKAIEVLKSAGGKTGKVALAAMFVMSMCASPLLAAPSDGGTPPDMPSGSASGGDAQGGGGTPPDGQGGGGQGGGGANTMTYDYSGTYSSTLNANGTEVTSKNETVNATDASTNVGLAQNGGLLTIIGDTLTKSGSVEDGDSCNFYGINSVVLAVGEASKALLSDTTISADSTGSNAIFATDNATIYANNVQINTTADNSRGLDATYGGTVIANNATITTQGAHCATLATDRGGGNVSLTNSQVSTAGDGSPLFYSTGCIEANNVVGTATGSQIACIEGLNTLLLSNCTVESTRSASTDTYSNGVMVYQSTSGDADTSTGEGARLQVYNSSLTSAVQGGAMFYFTNTSANVVISQSDINFDNTSSKLVTVAGNDASKNWGNTGSNGATVSFTGIDQTFNGDVSVDTISSLAMYLLSGTVWTGAASIETNSYASSVSEPLTVNVSSDSTWVVTEDSTVNNLNVEQGGSIVDSDGKTVTIVANGSTVVSGDSSVTLTVTGTYGTSFTTTDAQALQSATIDRSDFDNTYGVSTAFDGISDTGSTNSSDNIAVVSSNNQGIDMVTIVVIVVVAAVAVAAVVGGVAYSRKKKAAAGASNVSDASGTQGETATTDDSISDDSNNN